uniref:Protein kinase domain-containing protein n=1 Tax=Tetraselmis sp. GSL018 TaxID=582737 RepID=A0A061QZC9_9CHLO|eukprot:CAMPEP_0177602036 /NCGR_PEP_ID=MMETSP0419_2-20121207/14635_1 /TAXON_ID=582737 /ORGANISM="Tetraselmis sp., Strain GSL018" /LENGTH=420 /DNA_ID=CAMNT_0019095455 /DNA_START=567 /DNA_END=1829 /DNA_ORIENTATION=+
MSSQPEGEAQASDCSPGSADGSRCGTCSERRVEYMSILDFKAMQEVYRGRHSVVWRCRCRRTKAPLVVKGYVKERMRERHFQQVAREVCLMQQCRVAGVVGFAGSFEDSKCIYIVQEDCSKGDLFQMLNDNGGIMREQDVVRKVIFPLLKSLAQLHQLNVIHRDIKPENIFFNESGELKLGDFGLAICTRSERPKSRVGTLDYMAPEVISLPNHEEREAVEKKHGMQNVSYYGPKVDVWSVGILAYELLVGRPPFEVDGERETALRIMFDENIVFPPTVSADAVDFIKRSLTKSASKRPTSAEMLNHTWVGMHTGRVEDNFGKHPVAGLVSAPPQNSSSVVVASRQIAAEGAQPYRSGTAFPDSLRPAAHPNGMDVDGSLSSFAVQPAGKGGLSSSAGKRPSSGMNKLRNFFSSRLNRNS